MIPPLNHISSFGFHMLIDSFPLPFLKQLRCGCVFLQNIFYETATPTRLSLLKTKKNANPSIRENISETRIGVLIIFSVPADSFNRQFLFVPHFREKLKSRA